MKRLLEDRDIFIDTTNLKAADMRLILSGHDDFKYEKTALEHFMAKKGHRKKDTSTICTCHCQVLFF